MKLIHKVTLRLALAIMPVLLIWAIAFYFTMVHQVNDETDDSLDDYAEMIAHRVVSGDELPTPGDGSNNTYSIELLPPTEFYSDSETYEDREIYLHWKKEYEPARVLIKVFHDDDGIAYRLTVSTPTFERDDIIRALLIHIVTIYAILLCTSAVRNTGCNGSCLQNKHEASLFAFEVARRLSPRRWNGRFSQ